jgi:serine/threonine-protein kinase
LAQRAQLFGGRVVMSNGTRVLAAFEDGGPEQRYEALGWLDAVWTTSPDAAAGFASGEVLLATSDIAGSQFPLAIGLPTRQVDALLAECPAGGVLLSRAMGLALTELMPAGTVERMKGVRSGGVFYGVSNTSLDAHLPPSHRVAAKASHDMPTVEPPGSGMAQTRQREVTGDAPLQIGSEFDGRYRILSELGKGGMGVVYRARDLDLDDIVAIKTLHPSASMNTEQLERLKSELKLARKITHPNVLRTFDFGEFRGSAYISMEYVRGMTLRQLIGQAGKVPYTAALRIARQLCAGLCAAHEVGVLHRDIKPENLILEASGNAKLMDFGIARQIRRTEPGQTEAGMFVGTPHYSAPEQLAGEEVDHRCDIYAAGVLMCEMFSGELPYRGSSTVEIYAAQLQGPPTPPSAGWPEIPPQLEALILRCIKRDRNERFPDVATLAAELGQLRA